MYNHVFNQRYRICYCNHWAALVPAWQWQLYRVFFRILALSMLEVSSSKYIFFCCLSILTTRSGMAEVTKMSGGIVGPFRSKPGRSASISRFVGLSVRIVLVRWYKTELWHLVQRYWTKAQDVFHSAIVGTEGAFGHLPFPPSFQIKTTGKFKQGGIAYPFRSKPGRSDSISICVGLLWRQVNLPKIKLLIKSLPEKTHIWY